jgi:hypothetical protein
MIRLLFSTNFELWNLRERGGIRDSHAGERISAIESVNREKGQTLVLCKN